ncbi:D-2-hydroxyacid dehydrogenase [Thioalkalivibrio sp. ALJ24]|uniref:D-2-hydroxyacid dehydrogenase n=1 Tax=Thioalkalivibrio sp. ALJ24 TaxID=545276 RepID=UPI000368DD19|nr:D-2-hydroxyacid dehydrogenase [Thioalkalivibrio sp. ALJ24]
MAEPDLLSSARRAVFLDAATVDRDDLDFAVLDGAVPGWVRCERTPADPEAIIERLRGADIAITNKVVLDHEVLTRSPHLRLICAAATGFNNIDVAAARELGIAVANARDYATDSVAQHVMALLLTLVTRLDDYRADIRAGRWSESDQFCLLDHPIRTLSGMRMGIVGRGVLGQATARLAEAFGMQVSYAASLRDDADPAADNGRVPLPALLATSDVISLHCPLTDATRNLIDEDALDRLGPDGLLINTARGGLVEPRALARALREGRLGGAGIDVLEPEPPPSDHPLLAADLPRLVLTPHTAWAARSARQAVLEEIAANIRAFAAGEPRNRVD